MKKEKDSESFNEKMKAKGWREIDRSEAPKIKQPESPNDTKSRITIYLDTDIILHFKEMAENSGNGYQTLINKALRELVEGQSKNSDIKQEILQDQNFLKELKVVLYTGKNTSQLEFGELVDETLKKLGKELSVEFCSTSDYDSNKKYEKNIFFYDADNPPNIDIWMPGKLRKEATLNIDSALGRTNDRETIEKEVKNLLENWLRVSK